jgi:ADP-dependent NAD(P)H-hydrate dehydratase / NAD(P)H-hydrate epimerase
MRLVTASEIKEMDRLTINEIGIPGAVLMENAARGASRIFLEYFNPDHGAQVVIICGKGNNGGDGFAMARLLAASGLKVVIVCLAQVSQMSGAALVNFEILNRLGIEIIFAPTSRELAISRDRIEKCDYIIDGIFGTGLSSNVEGIFLEAIQQINASGKQVMSIDIPSGLNADTGQVMGAAVRADLTVTFGFPKLGQTVFPGAGLVGRLAVVDIGIPKMAADKVESRHCLTGPDDFNYFFQTGKRDTHKGDRGHLLILAGSTGKTGAAVMTAMGALRAGAGLVTVGVPASLNNILEVKLTEAMTEPLPETANGSLSIKARDAIFGLLEGKSAVAIGPGLSTNPETVSLVREIVAGCTLPMVIDADGLNALAAEPDVLKKLDGKKILTPHPGEIARLTGVNRNDIQFDRIGTITRFIEQYRCCMVLKGARTLISAPGEKIYLNPTGNPALSSGGSGDVLTGIISGLLSRGMPPIKAATAGAYLHGLAADLLSEDMGEAGMLASDLLNVIPGLMESLRKGEWPLKKTPSLVEHFGLL